MTHDHETPTRGVTLTHVGGRCVTAQWGASRDGARLTGTRICTDSMPNPQETCHATTRTIAIQDRNEERLVSRLWPSPTNHVRRDLAPAKCGTRKQSRQARVLRSHLRSVPPDRGRRGQSRRAVRPRGEHRHPSWPLFATHPPAAATIPMRRPTRHVATRQPTPRLPKWHAERPPASRPMVPSWQAGQAAARGNRRGCLESFFALSGPISGASPCRLIRNPFGSFCGKRSSSPRRGASSPSSGASPGSPSSRSSCSAAI